MDVNSNEARLWSETMRLKSLLEQARRYVAGAGDEPLASRLIADIDAALGGRERL